MPLGVGFIGSGFNARFHIQGWRGVRDADVLGVWSPNGRSAASAAALARDVDVGAAKPYKSIAAMVADPAIDAIWLCGPNHARIENVEEIVDTIARGKGTLKGIACEKPLARNVAEAKQVQKLVESVGLVHGYLEDQLFAPHVSAGHALLWARGAATTGRQRILDIVPGKLHQRVPVILGSKNEVERLERYHQEYDTGADRPFVSPLFSERSLFRDESRA